MKASIAVIGMGAIFPNALDVSEYWSNILSAKDCIQEVPGTIWDLSDYYDPTPGAMDKTYATRGGMVENIPFDSMEFGVPPKVMEAISVDQLFALVVAKQALLDANLLGPGAKPFNRQRMGVILASNIGKTAFSLSARMDVPKIAHILRNSNVPEPIVERVSARIKASQFEWSEASEPGFLPNVTAGRIGNRFDLYGTNCTVDAACAASLASLKYAMDELVTGDCDMMLTGGVMLDLTAFSFVSFSQTPALSRTNRIKPFDRDADGILLGDGVAMMVIKRLADAERDGDRIYGVIESIASSSDGRAKGIFAPRKEGQILALERAYDEAGIRPETLGMVEAHGTGTVVGDDCEMDALREYFARFSIPDQSILIGSVKSQIGHTRLSAGIASMIKALMALHQNILPPTINVETPSEKLRASPFYLTAKPRPWIVNAQNPIRRAGVSAFGFGGTNFHAVLREYPAPDAQFKRLTRSPASLVFHAESREALIAELRSALQSLTTGAESFMNDRIAMSAAPIPSDHPRLGFIAADVRQMRERLHAALERLDAPDSGKPWPAALSYQERAYPGKIATLFSGQGAQSVGMIAEAAVAYPEVRRAFTDLDDALIDLGKIPISAIVYPQTLPGDPMEVFERALTDTQYTQPALAAVCGGLYRILRNRGYREEVMIGHSFGELTALYAAGVLTDAAYARLAGLRGDAMARLVPQGTGMLAIPADPDTVRGYIAGYDRLYIANENSPSQTIVSGDGDQISRLAVALSKSVNARRLKVSAAFHTPFMENARDAFAEALDGVAFGGDPSRIIANATADFYPPDPEAAKSMLKAQMTGPVRFRDSVERAYDHGARVFVEIGPGRTLASLAGQILSDRPHRALAICPDKARSAHEQVEFLVTQLRVLGMEIANDPYLSPVRPRQDTARSKSAYMINCIHFLTDESMERIDDAVNTVDPVAGGDADQAAPNSAAASEPMPAAEPAPVAVAPLAVTPNPTAVLEPALRDPTGMPKPPPPMASEPGALSPPVPPTQPPAAPELVESAHNMNTGERIMDKEKTLHSIQEAYGLQALNTEVFKQFAQAQAAQLELFSQMLGSVGSNPASLEALVRFMEAFQQNSLRAYETYFMGQSGILSGMAPGSMPALKLGAGLTALPTPPSPPTLPAMPADGNSEPRPMPSPAAAQGPQRSAPSRPEPVAAPPVIIGETAAAGSREPAPIPPAVEPVPVVPAPTAAPRTEPEAVITSAPTAVSASVPAPEPIRVAPPAAPVSNAPAQTPPAIAAFESAQTAQSPSAAAPAPSAETPAPAPAVASAAAPASAPDAASASAAPSRTADEWEARIIEVISETTGYPPDMIEPEMNIESDLGIDSINRVQIFSVLNGDFAEGFTQEEIDGMTTLYTIRDFAEFLEKKK